MSSIHLLFLLIHFSIAHSLHYNVGSSRQLGFSCHVFAMYEVISKMSTENILEHNA